MKKTYLSMKMRYFKVKQMNKMIRLDKFLKIM